MEQKFPNHLSISRSSELPLKRCFGLSTENDMTDAEIFELNSLMAMQGKILTQNDIDYINTKRRVNARRGVTTPQYQAVFDDF